MTQRDAREADFVARWTAAGADRGELEAIAASVAAEAEADRAVPRIGATWSVVQARARARKRARVVRAGALAAASVAAVLLVVYRPTDPGVDSVVASWAAPERRVVPGGWMDLSDRTVLRELSASQLLLESGAIRASLWSDPPGTSAVRLVAGDLVLDTFGAIFAVRVDDGVGTVRVYDGTVRVVEQGGAVRDLGPTAEVPPWSHAELETLDAWAEGLRARNLGAKSHAEAPAPAPSGADEDVPTEAGPTRSRAETATTRVRNAGVTQGASSAAHARARDADVTEGASRAPSAAEEGAPTEGGPTSSRTSRASSRARDTDVSEGASRAPSAAETRVRAADVTARSSAEARGSAGVEEPGDRPRVSVDPARVPGVEPAPSAARRALAAELALYRQALRLLRSGNATAAAASFTDYLARYPRGALREEAELSRLEALWASGDRAAFERAAGTWLRLHAEHPRAGEVRALLERR